MEYDEQLKEYGILAKNTEKQIEDNKITIASAQIDKIDLEKLQEKNIKEIHIVRSEIKYIYFAKETTIDMKFECCNFKSQVIARECEFNNTITFNQCIFETIVDFSKAIFNYQTTFFNSTFKAEARFINTKFLAEPNESNDKTLKNSIQVVENSFRESTFEGNVVFNNAIFLERVDFGMSIFKGRVDFRQTKFLAEPNNNDNNQTAEVNFIAAIFEGDASFDKAIFLGRVNFGISRFKGEARFIETQFFKKPNNNQTAEVNFIESVFERDASFDEAIFLGRVNFGISRFKGEARFTKTKFLTEQGNSEIENNFRETTFEGNTSFGSAEFKGRVNFSVSKFKGEARFINTQFLAEPNNNEIENNFRESVFEGNTSFDNIIFKGRVDFTYSNFTGETSFADTNIENCIFSHMEFNKIKFIDINCKNIKNYIFENLTFKDTLSFENLNINELVFDDVIFKGIVTFNKTRLDNKPHFTNCTFSNQFNIEHKHIQYSYEEIEKTQDYSQLLNYRDLFRKLKSNRITHHNLIDASELHSQELYARELELDSKKTKTLKDKVEKWQLWFYRNLCDHHTDILQSFHSLMLVIGLFGLMGLGVITGFNYCLGYKPILSHLYMIKEIYDAHIHFFIKTHTLYTFLFNISILGFYLLMLFISIKWKIPRVFLIVVSYVVVIGILLVSPKILIPAMGIFTDKRALLDPLSTLGGIYTIVFGFVLFSFIKTIRKNSIVPN
ncbi:pentapeptide repeat-containing protein [Helicobacter sp.]|uniref:pentapeptide repeat-containing protein n=1 Tax=Helicobacter sp. TaxID=218 RepID=UPI002591196F|nr:pentapeptide repeat-containing protein [Helicobacter sp.]MCI7765717.1 pentapeptide repeat-containing protein [Helicobacter sp.]